MAVNAADLSPVPESQRTQPAFDLFLIFAAANVVATTLQTGAVLGSRFGAADVMPLVVGGALVGAVLVALLAPVGSRSGRAVDDCRARAARPATARPGGGAALPHQLRVDRRQQHHRRLGVRAGAGRLGDARWWAAALGVAATAMVAHGPRAVGRADRVAVPMMVVAGARAHVGGLHACAGGAGRRFRARAFVAVGP